MSHAAVQGKRSPRCSSKYTRKGGARHSGGQRGGRGTRAEGTTQGKGKGTHIIQEPEATLGTGAPVRKSGATGGPWAEKGHDLASFQKNHGQPHGKDRVGAEGGWPASPLTQRWQLSSGPGFRRKSAQCRRRRRERL